jgi:DNA polymerase III epsilon subunit-like protein
MIYIILDLEATCWASRSQAPNEIIEIGAVCVSDKNKILGEFCALQFIQFYLIFVPN